MTSLRDSIVRKSLAAGLCLPVSDGKINCIIYGVIVNPSPDHKRNPELIFSSSEETDKHLINLCILTMSYRL